MTFITLSAGQRAYVCIRGPIAPGEKVAEDMGMAEASKNVLATLKTGDLVLFAPPDLAGGLLGRLGRRAWKRVALVVRDAEHAEPMIWETAPGGMARGRLRRLAKRLEAHIGRISVRRLNRPLTAAQCDELAAWRHAVGEAPIRRSLIDLIGGGEDGWLGRDQAVLGAPLPAELAAEGYQRIGLLDDPEHGGLPAERYTPRHFSERAGLGLRQGYALGPELPLTPAEAAGAGEGLTVQPA